MWLSAHQASAKPYRRFGPAAQPLQSIAWAKIRSSEARFLDNSSEARSVQRAWAKNLLNICDSLTPFAVASLSPSSGVKRLQRMYTNLRRQCSSPIRRARRVAAVAAAIAMISRRHSATA